MTRKKRLLVVVAGFAIIGAAVLFANPYPRQYLFGPKIRDVPLCAWQEAFRRGVFVPIGGLAPDYEDGFWAKWRHWLGQGDASLKYDDFVALTVPERELLLVNMADDELMPVRRVTAKHFGSFDSPAALAALLRLLED